MKKIAIVVQRYGLEVNGGAEYHARILAEKLSEFYDVEVITTCAKDHGTWANEYIEGTEVINGIPVRRFKSEEKNQKRFRKIRRKLVSNIQPSPFLTLIRKIRKSHQESLDMEWLQSQGPYCPELVQFIRENANTYHKFIFFTYLYYPTVVGVPLVKEKSIFIPTAHNEAPLFFPVYRNLFADTGFIMFNTESEKKLIERTFPNHCRKNDVAGIGITPYTGNFTELPFGLVKNRYFLYIGRIQGDKGCQIMIDYFKDFKSGIKEYNDVKLVLAGNNYLKETPADPDIIFTGFVDEQLKYTLLHYCTALVIPSFYESLSLVTLEAMMMGKPVIANAKCEVLADHIRDSKSGSMFETGREFGDILQKYLKMDQEDLDAEGRKGKTYVQSNYNWDRILAKFHAAINC